MAQAAKVWKIGYLAPGLPDDGAFLRAFLEGLEALGLAGRTLVVAGRAPGSKGADGLRVPSQRAVSVAATARICAP